MTRLSPIVAFDKKVCGDLAASLQREWIVTNGLGGYASGTVAGANTRRYHGLLVAALTPPVGRTVLVAGVSEWAVLDGRRYPLSTQEYGDRTIDPPGYQYIETFALDGMLPIWTYSFEDALLERRIWMAYGHNTTYIGYRLVQGSRPVTVEVTPFVTYRNFHTLRRGDGWRPKIVAEATTVTILAHDVAVPYRLLVAEGRFTSDGVWWWNFLRREETARGLDDLEDLFAPGLFEMPLAPGRHVAFVMTTEETSDLDGTRTLTAVRDRQQALLRRAGAEASEPVVRQLTLAADQFIARRDIAGCTGKTVLAGYHWFNDWGRDTAIALPGLALSTGRYEEAAAILRAFAKFVRDGLLPNNFPDHAGVDPAYNTADASLWYVLAVRAYHETTGDATLAGDLLPVLCDIVERHIAGTRHGIGMDPRDGLLRAGERGMQLTWMDVKIGDTLVTPRFGKPVEINALWYNSLCTVAALRAESGDGAASRYDALADRVRSEFRARFIRSGGGSLADVVDGPGGDDLTVRPNQIFSVSLPFPLLVGDEAAAVVEAVGRTLLTTYGLRSLDPAAPGYRGTYEGDTVSRDTAYHQGTAWAWLMGAYTEAYYRVTGDAIAALRLLRPFEHHLQEAGLGTISEIFDGDPPHRPRGCIAQAWSVAEVLRVWRALSRGRTFQRA